MSASDQGSYMQGLDELRVPLLVAHVTEEEEILSAGSGPAGHDIETGIREGAQASHDDADGELSVKSDEEQPSQQVLLVVKGSRAPCCATRAAQRSLLCNAVGMC